MHDFRVQILPISCTATAVRMLWLPSCAAPLRPPGTKLWATHFWSYYSISYGVKAASAFTLTHAGPNAYTLAHRKGTNKVATALLAAANRWQGRRSEALWALRILTNMSCSAASNHLLLTPETMHFLLAAVQPCTGASSSQMCIALFVANV